MKGLIEIAEHDSKWRNIALRITNNKAHADDIVQEMYIKLVDKEEEVSDYYITLTLKSIFIDNYRKKINKVNYVGAMEQYNDLEDSDITYEPTDEEQELLNRINKLPYIQKELLEEAYDRSLREIGDTYNINYVYAHRQIKKAVAEVLGDDSHLYKNSNLKYLKK